MRQVELGVSGLAVLYFGMSARRRYICIVVVLAGDQIFVFGGTYRMGKDVRFFKAHECYMIVS